MIQTITGGDKVQTCPWRSFGDPVCADVINAFGWYESGQIALYLGNDPPSHLIRGLAVYRAAYNATQSDRLDRQRKKGK